MLTKKYQVNLTNGEAKYVTAEIVTYDQCGNLIFMNNKKTLQTHDNPDGQSLELVHCFNSRHYIDYCHAPIQH